MNLEAPVSRPWLVVLAACCLALSSCKPASQETASTDSGHEAPTAEYERGPHSGRMLLDGSFAIELAIFETGVPPEFRAWATDDGKPLAPGSVTLEVQLTRLGAVKDRIQFEAEGDYLRGNQVIYEPHSFVVHIDAKYSGKNYQWQYDSIEGRTQIAPAVAEAFGLETETAGPAVIHETVDVYGQVQPNGDRIGVVRARFDGMIRSDSASLGDTVKAGQPLLTIESNESLKTFTVTAPISGTITARDANAGEPTAGRALFTIVDTSTVWVSLDIFPTDLQRVQAGAPVIVYPPQGGEPVGGTIDRINPMAERHQAVKARVVLDNGDGRFFPGSLVQAQIQVAEYEVPLAVKRTGLQGFRDFTVVYAQIGDEYEVRMLEMGRQDAEWVEVLGGLEPGTTYVTTNSYLVKADIEKSGASHDH